MKFLRNVLDLLSGKSKRKNDADPTNNFQQNQNHSQEQKLNQNFEDQEKQQQVQSEGLNKNKNPKSYGIQKFSHSTSNKQSNTVSKQNGNKTSTKSYSKKKTNFWQRLLCCRQSKYSSSENSSVQNDENQESNEKNDNPYWKESPQSPPTIFEDDSFNNNNQNNQTQCSQKVIQKEKEMKKQKFVATELLFKSQKSQTDKKKNKEEEKENPEKKNLLQKTEKSNQNKKSFSKQDSSFFMKSQNQNNEEQESVVDKEMMIVNDELSSNDSQGFKSFICPLCLKFQYKCVTTVCGHSFCEKCLDEYLILKKTCFVCDQVIRNKLIINCFSVDNVIEQILQRSSNKEQLQSWNQQKLEYKQWLDKRRVESIDVGSKVDIRDTEYIWCVGTVTIKIESANKDPLLVIHYDGWNKYFDELLSQYSPRLAPFGVYTSREDIPRYSLKSENSMQGQIINRISSNGSSSMPSPTTALLQNLSQSQNENMPLVQSVPQPQQQSQQQQQQLQIIPQQQNSNTQRREQNAAIGDRLNDRIDEFFYQFDENLQENEQTSPNNNVVFLRNALSNLNDAVGGDSIVDSLLGGGGAASLSFNSQRRVPQTQVIQNFRPDYNRLDRIIEAGRVHNQQVRNILVNLQNQRAEQRRANPPNNALNQAFQELQHQHQQVNNQQHHQQQDQQEEEIALQEVRQIDNNIEMNAIRREEGEELP